MLRLQQLLLVLVVLMLGMARARVVVVGGGLAGLSSALELADRGVPVTIIDMEKGLGGNSMKASSGINACGTNPQKHLGITDSTDAFYADTMKSGDQMSNPALTQVLVQESKDAVEWLIEQGVPLLDVTLCGGHSVARTHWIPSPKEGKPIPVGFETIKQLKQRVADAQEEGKDIDVKLLTRALDLVLDGGKVTGLKIETKTAPDTEAIPSELQADAVILTTGGFSNDHAMEDSLLDEFAPDKKEYPTTNGPFATGSGIKMVRRALPNVGLVGMDNVQIHPTGFIDPVAPKATTKFLAAEALRGSGGILVNHDGERFADELTRRDVLTKAILDNCAMNFASDTHVAFIVMNKAAIDKFGWPAFNFYFKIKKFFNEFPDAETAAKAMGFKKEAFVKMLNAYNYHAQAKKADKFGKTIYPIDTFDLESTFYIGQVTPSIHYTMGGLAIDADGHVLTETGDVIEGLYAAGEVTGGVHGSNRLGGNSLLECVVFGRRTAKRIAEKSGKRDEL